MRILINSLFNSIISDNSTEVDSESISSQYSVSKDDPRVNSQKLFIFSGIVSVVTFDNIGSDRAG